MITLRAAINIGVGLRIFVAVWNGFFGPSPYADLDALSFHFTAVEYAHNPIFDEFRIGWVFANVLGLFYYITTDSLFLGSLLSCAAWFASAVILVKCLRILSVNQDSQIIAMLIYALLPSSIFLTSITLREPYQLLFVNLAIYATLKIYMQRMHWHWLTLIFAVMGVGSLHGGLLAFGVLLFAGTLLLVSMGVKVKIPWARFGVMGVAVVAVLGSIFFLFGDASDNFSDVLGSSIELFQQGLLGQDARADYASDEVVISGFGDLLFFVPIALFQYLFEPFPWHISAASDIVVVIENMLRGWLIWEAWKAVQVSSAIQRRALLFILFAYLMIEAIWSFGTINWGTAVRHHIPAWGLLLLVSAARSPERYNEFVCSKVKC